MHLIKAVDWDSSNQHIEKNEGIEKGISLVIAVDHQRQQLNQLRQQEEMIQEWKDNVERLEAKCAQIERELVHEKKDNERVRVLEEATKNKLHAELLQQQEQEFT